MREIKFKTGFEEIDIKFEKGISISSFVNTSKPRLNLGSRFIEKSQSVIYIDTEFSKGDLIVIVSNGKIQS